MGTDCPGHEVRLTGRLAFPTNQTADRTGNRANRGLGLEIGRQLGRKGYLALLGCRSEARGAEGESLLRAEGTKAQAVLLDVANPSSIAAARDTVEQHFPRLDALVNNAAIYYDT